MSIILLSSCGSPPAEQHVTWSDYGGGPDMSKYVAADEITKENVNQLRVAWTYPTSDQASYQFNPIIVDTIMYVMAKNNSLVALNAITGEEIWIHANLRGISRRGANYWESEDRTDRRLLIMMNNTLQAIDAMTGKSILTFGNNGIVDLREGLDKPVEEVGRIQSGTPGRVFENLIILGSSPGEGWFSAPGHLRAYNVVTGELAWVFHTIPQPGEYGYDTWPKDAYKYVGGVNTWGEITVDEERGIAFFPLGSPTYDYYGGDRLGSNLYGSSLLALDARTGKRLWHFQTVHHDLWDYDLTAAPQLTTINKDGKTIDVVAAATKQGFLFVFNRETGEPIWPIEERPVPPSDIPGEQAWPTQPFPTAPPPFARQKMTKEDLVPFFLNAEQRAGWEIRLDSMKTGLFTPPSLKEVAAVPGAVGGANWGNTASNPTNGTVYVLSHDFPSFYKLEPVEEQSSTPQQRAQARPAAQLTEEQRAQIGRGRTVYEQRCEICHGQNREGSSAGPAIAGLVERLLFADLNRIVTNGQGRMPAVQHIDESEVRDLHYFLQNASAPAGGGGGNFFRFQQNEPETPEGPVVASGGAPRENEAGGGGGGFGRGPQRGYPEGVEAPKQRFRTGYGLGHPYIMSPPWSTITAYDLNTGTIKWKRAHGQDKMASELGFENTGVPRGTQRNGMVVTSTGIVFATAKDGKVYAYDEANGDILWAGELPCGTEGLPSMYVLDGKQYLVINATTPVTWGMDSREGGLGGERSPDEGGYVVFALPENR